MTEFYAYVSRVLQHETCMWWAPDAKSSEIINYFVFKKNEEEKPREQASKDNGKYLRLQCWNPS